MWGRTFPSHPTFKELTLCALSKEGIEWPFGFSTLRFCCYWSADDPFGMRRPTTQTHQRSLQRLFMCYTFFTGNNFCLCSVLCLWCLSLWRFGNGWSLFLSSLLTPTQFQGERLLRRCFSLCSLVVVLVLLSWWSLIQNVYWKQPVSFSSEIAQVWYFSLK